MKTNKKTFRRIACLLLVICFAVLSLASCGKSVPNAEDANGTFGAITWEYKKDTKTLTLTGAVAIGDVDPNEDNAPWAGDVRVSAEKIVINEGITSVGTYALWGFSNVTQITLPASLRSIGDYGFAYCGKLASINFPANLSTLGKGAFEGCGTLSAVFLPAGVTAIQENTFAYCYNLKSAILMGENLTVGANAFRNCRSLTNVVVRPSVNTALFNEAAGIEDASKISVKASDNATGTATITIRYMKDGAEINTVVKTLDLYATLTEPTPAIEGYTADKNSVTVTGSAVDETIVVTYTPNAPAETEPVESTPQTPEVTEPEEEKNPISSIIAIVIMVLVLAGIGVGAFFLIRSDKKKGNSTTVRKNDKGGKK